VSVGLFVGPLDGNLVGISDIVGYSEGSDDGEWLGESEGSLLGLELGPLVGLFVGKFDKVGRLDGESLGVVTGLSLGRALSMDGKND